MEFELSQRDFEFISRLARERAGISLPDSKRTMVRGRLVRRLRQLGLTSFKQYCALLDKGEEAELVELCNAITTNVTAFFRERHHFDLLRDQILPDIDSRLADSSPINIWSAGCSTGQEPWSIAMTCAEALGGRRAVRILATDLDTNVLARGQTGVYEREGAALEDAELRRWFQRGRGANADMIRVRDELRKMVSFRRLNLIEPFRMHTRFHVLFCRNVVIYFNKDTQRDVFDRFANQMASDGTLFIGHSESLMNVSDRFEMFGPTAYRRVA